MGARVTLEVKGIENLDDLTKGLDEAVNSAVMGTAQWLQSAIVEAEVIPFRTGRLQGSLRIEDDGIPNQVSLITDEPYAARLYYHPEYNFNREFNINAQAGWFEQFSDDGIRREEVIEKFNELLKEQLS